MEANRDEAQRCYTLALKALERADYATAERLARKSCSLHPTERARQLIARIQDLPSRRDRTGSSPPRPPPRPAPGEDGGGTHPRTPDPAAHTVRHIQGLPADAYYEILDLKHEASDADIKKAYRKLALLLHPDKNSAPGADEAFKKVSKAFSVLSDAQKRSTYDRLGTDPDLRGAGGPPRGPRAGAPPPFFAQELDPEAIFRAFFGGQAFQFVPVRDPPPAAAAARRRRAPPPPPLAASGALWQLLPLLLVLALSLLQHLWREPAAPDFAFAPQLGLRHRLHTPRWRAPFFVHEPTWRLFERTHPAHTPAFLAHVEAAYLARLERQCELERQHRAQDLARLQGGWFGKPRDPAAYEQVRTRPLPGCERLKEMGMG